jgi:hypothetical protein
MEKKTSEKMTEERRARLQFVSTTALIVASTILPPESFTNTWSLTLYLAMFCSPKAMPRSRVRCCCGCETLTPSNASLFVGLVLCLQVAQ